MCLGARERIIKRLPNKSAIIHVPNRRTPEGQRQFEALDRAARRLWRGGLKDEAKSD